MLKDISIIYNIKYILIDFVNILKYYSIINCKGKMLNITQSLVWLHSNSSKL